MPEWNGRERRLDSNQVCSLHGGLDAKLDEILQQNNNHTADIAVLKNTIENGMKSHIEAIKDKVEIIEKCIDSFGWFQTWVTELRDNLFKNVIKLTFVTAIIWFIATFGKQAITRIIG
jgi:hypothetical protein